jgi:class 3 adenylate cyclase
MIPYKVIRRWSVGEGEAACTNERVVKTVHDPRSYGTLGLLIVSFLIIDIAALPISYSIFWGLVLLIAPNVVTFFALRKPYPIPFLIQSYCVDWAIGGFILAASDFSPVVMAVGGSMVVSNAINTGGAKPGPIACLGLAGFAVLFHVLVPDYIDTFVMPKTQGCLMAVAGIGYFWAQALGNHRVYTALKKERKKVQTLNKQIKEQVLVRYLPPDLINDIFDGKISMDTKPHTKEITVLFSDLSGFTKMSEKHGAEVVADFLNDYLTIMNETIFANKGTIDKFIGDAIMVIFGAPVEMSEEDQAKNAARCAIAMQRGMVLVNEKWKAKGIDEVSMRIGIHQGMAVVGNFGSKQRVDYTAIGPSVNLAARIETACTPGEIYVSQEVRELLHDEPPTDLAGDFELKGIEGKTSLYKLVDWS